MIIETSDNRFFQVTEATEAAWIGVEVKRIKGEWIEKAKARPALVRKAATRVVKS